METSAYSALRDAIQAEIPAASAKIIAGSRSGNQLVLIHPNRAVGSLGTADADEVALRRLRDLLRDGGTGLVELAGERVFLEAHLPPPHLVIIGAVHIAIPLVTFGHTLGFRTTVIDARGQFATDERFPHADRLIEASPDERWSN